MMMKHSAVWMVVTTLIVGLMGQDAFAGGTDAVRSKSFGIGLGGGNSISGLSLKVPGGASAIQATLGLHPYGIGFGLDGLLEMPELAAAPGVLGVAWNLGVGGGLYLWDNGPFDNTNDGIGISVSGIAGLEFNFDVLPTLPFDIVLEYRPTLFVFPGVGLDLIRFTSHIRVYF
jgi:hypothetical protein